MAWCRDKVTRPSSNDAEGEGINLYVEGTGSNMSFKELVRTFPLGAPPWILARPGLSQWRPIRLRSK